jgi:hypothetical protein
VRQHLQPCNRRTVRDGRKKDGFGAARMEEARVTEPFDHDAPGIRDQLSGNLEVAATSHHILAMVIFYLLQTETLRVAL